MSKTNDDINTIISQYLSEYYFPVKPDIKPYIVSDIDTALQEMASTSFLKSALSKQDHSNFNGSIFMYNQNKFAIILSNKVFSYNDYTWVGTVYHELTHIFDYSLFCKKYKIYTYDDLMKNNYYNTFTMWSEAHARRLGYKKVRECTYGQLDQEGDLQFIYKELDLIKKNFISNYSSNLDTLNDIYNLMQIMGRIVLFSLKFPEYTNEFFKKVFGNIISQNETRLYKDIFYFLIINKDAKNILNKLEDFDDLIFYE